MILLSVVCVVTIVTTGNAQVPISDQWGTVTSVEGMASVVVAFPGGVSRVIHLRDLLSLSEIVESDDAVPVDVTHKQRMRFAALAPACRNYLRCLLSNGTKVRAVNVSRNQSGQLMAEIEYGVLEIPDSKVRWTCSLQESLVANGFAIPRRQALGRPDADVYDLEYYFRLARSEGRGVWADSDGNGTTFIRKPLPLTTKAQYLVPLPQLFAEHGRVVSLLVVGASEADVKLILEKVEDIMGLCESELATYPEGTLLSDDVITSLDRALTSRVKRLCSTTTGAESAVSARIRSMFVIPTSTRLFGAPLNAMVAPAPPGATRVYLRFEPGSTDGCIQVIPNHTEKKRACPNKKEVTPKTPAGDQSDGVEDGKREGGLP